MNKELFTIFDAQKAVGPVAFTTMLKPAGSTCNLDCSYCYYLDKAIQYAGRQAVMSDQMLETYINNWDAQRPTGNHVDEARDIYARLKSEIDVTIKGEEDRDWERVDMFSKASIIGHLSKYPDTAHRSEIDDAVWNLVNKESELDIREYRELFINGKPEGNVAEITPAEGTSKTKGTDVFVQVWGAPPSTEPDTETTTERNPFYNPFF